MQLTLGRIQVFTTMLVLISFSCSCMSYQAAAVELYPQDAFANHLVAEVPVFVGGRLHAEQVGSGEHKEGIFTAGLSDVCRRCLQLFLVGVSLECGFLVTSVTCPLFHSINSETA